ncbi:hypothetical protein OAF44_01560 [Akkermansiaceae bacterium]|nr:hypothetical protein [Akkermansiaceae bacterium]
MAVFSIKSFGGIAPVVPPRYLQDNQAQTAINCPVFQGSIQAIADLGASVADLPKTGTIKSLYRFGQDTISDNNYWFHWTADVDVCRGQVAGDVSEWTFFTGDGGPKATYNSLALSGSNYPANTRPLGLPSPVAAAVASADTFTADQHAATIFLTPSHISSLTTTYGVLISTAEDDASDYTTVSLSGTITAASVVAAINAALSSTVTATVDSGSVQIDSVAEGAGAKLFVKFQTGTTSDTDGTFSYDSSPDLQATGTTDTEAFVVITDAEIGSISSGDKLTVTTDVGTHVDDVSYTFSGTLTSSAFATYLNTQLGTHVEATAYGSSVVLTPDQSGTGAGGSITYVRKASDVVATTLTSSGSESAGPAQLFVTQTHIDAMEGQYLALEVNGEETIIPVVDPAYTSQFSTLSSYGISSETYGSVEPFAVVTTTAVGTSATIRVRTGDYPNEATFTLQQSEGYEDEDDTLETRVYAYTYVNKESGFEFESAPSGPSGSVDVRDGQTVTLSGFSGVPEGDYVVTNKRIYRAVSGVYLFVKEIGIADANFTDDVKPDELGEELPTLTWSAPPQTLRGLTNLPNGLMAGFSGRDIYFCDPYHPHAWPEQYIQTIDYPVVGLGRMDTTLAVLTKGTPYFIQGTHPLNMAVVKSDLEQACVSKNSIVSLMGGVMYAAPDGLMLLSPGGSRIVTENLFDFKQWQAFFKPESIHAYQQDNQYIAFYDNGTQRGGFIFDVRSGQFILHDIYADAGYHDLLRDKLFLAVDDSGNKVKPWGYGSTKSYIWRSKKFSLPQVMGFSCAQLEAEAYPMTLKFYLDNTLYHTQTVQNRNPFRLPAKVGRDLEMQVEGSNEVFSLSIANSMTELASG